VPVWQGMTANVIRSIFSYMEIADSCILGGCGKEHRRFHFEAAPSLLKSVSLADTQFLWRRTTGRLGRRLQASSKAREHSMIKFLAGLLSFADCAWHTQKKPECPKSILETDYNFFLTPTLASQRNSCIATKLEP
jgi:hypothetical protein